MADKRKSISKKTRFEVFKRDKFTCQYCGKQAPDVVLEIDHIKPVSKGGNNGIMNLITSCRDCNRGKSNRELSDDTVVKKQQEQLKELADRKEQLEMMLDWRRNLENIQNDYIDIISDCFAEKTEWSPNEHGRKTIKKWLKEFSLNEILDAIDIAIDVYYKDTSESWNEAFNKVSGICHNSRLQQNDPRSFYTNYILKAIRNNSWYCDESRIRAFILNNVQDDEAFEKTKICLYNSRHWSDFIENLRNEFGVYV